MKIFKMVKFFAVLLLFIASNFLLAQQSGLKITNLSPKSENFIFPLISYPQKPLVEKKINTFLQVDELEYIPNSGKNPFLLASTATNSFQNYLYYYGWEKLKTPKNILSLEMDGEASGAYPEGFTNYKNFDLRTGNLINLEDLFLPDSRSVIEKIINEHIRKRVNDYLIELKSSQEKENGDAERIAMYEDCFTENTLSYLKFYFRKNELTFVAGRCSNHALLALDDLGSHEISLSYKDLDTFFSPYAKNVLSGSDLLNKTSFQNKLYTGKIDGKYPITVLITRLYDEENSFNAVYWYDKSKKLIAWDGKINGNHLSIIENDYYDKNTGEWIVRAIIEADFKENKIEGIWQDFKTKKNLKLELEEL